MKMEIGIVPQLILQLSHLPKEVEGVLNLFDNNNLSWKPSSWDGIPGEKFSAIEQICHLRDIEKEGYHKRIETMLHEDNPTLASVEGYELVKSRNYNAENLRTVIADFKIARENTISIIKKIEPHQWSRTGYFEEYGKVTVLGLIYFLISHDHEHLASLHWLLGKIEGNK